MAKLSLRRYEDQARISVYVSIAALVFVAVLAFLILQHLVIEGKVPLIPYNPKSLRMPLVYAFGLTALGLGAAGFGLGLNSAGQRRNDKPTHSWIGFFLGAGAITLSLILLFLFRSWGEPVMG